MGFPVLRQMLRTGVVATIRVARSGCATDVDVAAAAAGVGDGIVVVVRIKGVVPRHNGCNSRSTKSIISIIIEGKEAVVSGVYVAKLILRASLS
jgi:hypothetical protein